MEKLEIEIKLLENLEKIISDRIKHIDGPKKEKEIRIQELKQLQEIMRMMRLQRTLEKIYK